MAVVASVDDSRDHKADEEPRTDAVTTSTGITSNNPQNRPTSGVPRTILKVNRTLPRPGSESTAETTQVVSQPTSNNGGRDKNKVVSSSLGSVLKRLIFTKSQ
jgi:hypothetical protein